MGKDREEKIREMGGKERKETRNDERNKGGKEGEGGEEDGKQQG